MHCVGFVTISQVPLHFEQAAELKSVNNINTGFKTHFSLKSPRLKLKLLPPYSLFLEQDLKHPQVYRKIHIYI